MKGVFDSRAARILSFRVFSNFRKRASFAIANSKTAVFGLWRVNPSIDPVGCTMRTCEMLGTFSCLTTSLLMSTTLMASVIGTAKADSTRPLKMRDGCGKQLAWRPSDVFEQGILQSTNRTGIWLSFQEKGAISKPRPEGDLLERDRYPRSAIWASESEGLRQTEASLPPLRGSLSCCRD